MIKVLNVEQTRQAEASADAYGYSYDQMMQSAGRATAELALQMIADRETVNITVLVGAGNNGGDGLVAAIELSHLRPDANVRLYLLKARTDALIAVAEESGRLHITQAEDDSDGRVLRHMIASSDLVIDALFGIGVRLPLKDQAAKILRGTRQALNERARARRARVFNDPCTGGQIQRPLPALVLAVDCPSGLNCDTGERDKLTLSADATLTFIGAKPGLLSAGGVPVVGKLYVAPLDMPEEVRVIHDAGDILLDNETVRNLLPVRAVNAHKGTFGKVLIVGGSEQYTGAVALATRGAYRSGAGLVALASIQKVIERVAVHQPEVVYLPLEGATHITRASLLPVLQAASAYQVMLVGPGIGTEEHTRGFMAGLLSAREIPPLVIDADGLNLLTRNPDWQKHLPAQTILTPHPGEMARLCGISTQELAGQDRLMLAREKALAWGVTLVLKGAHTVIASPDGRTATSPFKTGALATAGTGDILAGIIAGLRAQGLGVFEAAQAGVYIHGLSGTLAEQIHGQSYSVIAGDVLEHLSGAFQHILRG